VYGTVQAGESTADFRTRMAARQAEELEHWQKQLAEQTSVLNSPSERIRVWERRHQIDLPLDPGHRLIKLIASNTGLSAEDVYAEQRLRAEARVNVVSSPT
jgi:ABC-type phosphate transport system auxiliary subunit